MYGNYNYYNWDDNAPLKSLKSSFEKFWKTLGEKNLN